MNLIKKIEIPENLLLLPFIPDKILKSELKANSIKHKKLLHSELMNFESYSIITGFIGYPALLTIFNFIGKLEQKNIVFIGTAGGIGNRFDHPELVGVKSISADEHLAKIFGNKKIEMKTVETLSEICEDGITVDILQRETEEWVNRCKTEMISFVEMELYPAASFLGEGFEAYVIITDRVDGAGSNPFMDKLEVKRKFKYILEEIIKRYEKKGCSHP